VLKGPLSKKEGIKKEFKNKICQKVLFVQDFFGFVWLLKRNILREIG